MQHADVARLVVIADSHGEVIQRRQPVPVLGLKSGQPARELCLIESVATVLRDEHAAAHRLERAVGISVAEGKPAREKCVRKHHGLPVASAASMRPLAVTIASSVEPAGG